MGIKNYNPPAGMSPASGVLPPFSRNQERKERVSKHNAKRGILGFGERSFIVAAVNSEPRKEKAV